MVTFPDKEASILLQGPAGALQVVAAPAKEGESQHMMVICHPHPLHGGTMDNKVVTTLYRSFRQMGFDVLRFNYRGVGASEGSFDDTIGETEDLLAVIEWLGQQRPDKQLWLAGFSFGAFVATKGALRSDCQQLISIAPPVHHYDFATLPPMYCPWLVIQPEEDEVVPPEAVYQWAATRQDLQLVRIANSSHFFHGKLIELREALQTHLSTAL